MNTFRTSYMTAIAASALAMTIPAGAEPYHGDIGNPPTEIEEVEVVEGVTPPAAESDESQRRLADQLVLSLEEEREEALRASVMSGFKQVSAELELVSATASPPASESQSENIRTRSTPIRLSAVRLLPEDAYSR